MELTQYSVYLLWEIQCQLMTERRENNLANPGNSNIYTALRCLAALSWDTIMPCNMDIPNHNETIKFLSILIHTFSLTRESLIEEMKQAEHEEKAKKEMGQLERARRLADTQCAYSPDPPISYMQCLPLDNLYDSYENN